MGNYSWLRALRNNPEGCIINWNAMNTSKLYMNYHLMCEHEKPENERAKTLADMAHIWNDTKFVGYFDKDYITALQEFTLHLKPYDCTPRLYYEYEGWEELWYIEFIPGTEIVNYGVCRFSSFMEDMPKHPEEYMKPYTSEDEEQWCNDRDAFKKALFTRLIDNGKWSSSKRLVCVEMSEADRIMQLYALLHSA